MPGLAAAVMLILLPASRRPARVITATCSRSCADPAPLAAEVARFIGHADPQVLP